MAKTRSIYQKNNKLLKIMKIFSKLENQKINHNMGQNQSTKERALELEQAFRDDTEYRVTQTFYRCMFVTRDGTIRFIRENKIREYTIGYFDWNLNNLDLISTKSINKIWEDTCNKISKKHAAQVVKKVASFERAVKKYFNNVVLKDAIDQSYIISINKLISYSMNIFISHKICPAMKYDNSKRLVIRASRRAAKEMLDCDQKDEYLSFIDIISL